MKLIMEKTLKVLKDMEKNGVIGPHAIGGGMAVLFYTEPILTYDLDVFIFLPSPSGPSGLVTLGPIYDYLKKRGYRPRKEHILIEGVPVQFIPVYNELLMEAVDEARETTYGHVDTKVVRVEHLIAISLQTGRAKDRTRILQLLEEAKINRSYLASVLERHGLGGRWKEFRKKFGYEKK